MKLEFPINLIPGIVLAFVLYSFSEGINNFFAIAVFGYDKSPISTAMIAIIFGLALSNIFKIRKGFLIGLDFTQKYILKLGIIFLGIQLKPFEFLKFSAIAIPLIMICIISVLVVIKLLIKKFKISRQMSYLIAIGSTVCGTTAIMATGPIIKAKKSEIAYAVANMTVFGIIAMLCYPYFANYYFEGDSLFSGLFLGTAIHETAQVAAAGLIYDQQFNSPETLNISTVTKLIRNTFLVIMIPLFAYLYNRGNNKSKKYSLISIFPYFVLGFITFVIFRNAGDYVFLNSVNSYDEFWLEFVSAIKFSAKVFLTMAMGAIGLSTNLKDLKSMGYKPFIVGFISLLTVGIVSLSSIEFFGILVVN